jgi:hypothetical protein
MFIIIIKLFINFKLLLNLIIFIINHFGVIFLENKYSIVNWANLKLIFKY